MMKDSVNATLLTNSYIFISEYTDVVLYINSVHSITIILVFVVVITLIHYTCP